VTGIVAWMTGLPASGKSTLALHVRERLGGVAVLLDGDEIRDALEPRPGYGDEARDAFYRTLARLAALLARQGHVVLVAATAPRRVHRETARALAPAFFEVYVRTPLAECERRDPKGLFARARRGEAPDLPGLGAPYEEPSAAEIVADGGNDEVAIAAIVAALRPSTHA
jgi:adenylylsulfate kinase